MHTTQPMFAGTQSWVASVVPERVRVHQRVGEREAKRTVLASVNDARSHLPARFQAESRLKRAVNRLSYVA